MTETSKVVNLYTAVENNSLEDVKRCLEDSGVDIEMTGGVKLSTPLILATSLYFVNNEIAMLLLAKKANPFAQNKDGDTSLGMAAFWGNVELVKTILDMSEDIQPLTCNRNGYTACSQTEMMAYVCRDNPSKVSRFNEIRELLQPYDQVDDMGDSEVEDMSDSESDEN